MAFPIYSSLSKKNNPKFTVHEDIWSESLIVKLVDAWLRSVATAIFGGEPLTNPKE